MFRCKPPGAKPRAGRYVRVGHNKIWKKKEEQQQLERKNERKKYIKTFIFKQQQVVAGGLPRSNIDVVN